MPRQARKESQTGIYHVISKGVNKKNLFHSRPDYRFYSELLLEYRNRFGLDIYHYCLMTNHTHMLVRVKNLDLLSKFSYFVQRRYAIYYLKQYRWPGQVFQRNFKSFTIDSDAYLLECGRYIERNPVRVDIVSDPEHYPYSSYRHYVRPSCDPLVTESPAYVDLARSSERRREIYRDYVRAKRPYEAMVDQVLI